MLNVPRLLWQQTATLLRALRWMRSTQLPLEFFDALAASLEEAEAMQYEHNRDAVIAETHRRGAF